MAIITKGEKQILHYSGVADEAAALNFREFCKRHNVRGIEANQADLTKKIGELLNLPSEAAAAFAAGQAEREEEQGGTKVPPADILQTELYLLCGFEADTRDAVLKAMREEEVGQGALKAMATDSNIHWPLKRVLDDVSYENQIMSAYMELRKTLHVTSILIETVGLPPQAKEEFDLRHAKGMQIVESGQIPDDPVFLRQLTRELKILITMGEEERDE